MPERRDPMKALQKAETIGDARKSRGNLPVDTFENQQPDPLQGLIDLIGHPFENMGMAPGMTPAVAAGGPGNIKNLKENGARLIQRLKTIGYLPSVHEGNLTGQPRHLAPEVIEQLEWLQKRYPRIFGHLREITATDEGSGGVEALGRMIPTDEKGLRFDGPAKYSRMELNPNLVDYKAAEGKIPMDTIAHELLHSTQRIMEPNLMKSYEDAWAKAPGATQLEKYFNNPYEVAARKQGEISTDKFLYATGPDWYKSGVDGLRKATGQQPIRLPQPKQEPEGFFTILKKAFGLE